MKNSVIYIGWINKGKPADCGETVKNQLCIKRLQELGVHCRQIDFKNWKRHPWVFAQLLGDLLFHKDETIIMSTSPKNVYPMMKLMKKLNWKQNLVHWVIGGSFGEKVKKGIYKSDIISQANFTLVESDLMVEQLEECGVKGVKQVSNFKPINYYPEKQTQNNKPFKFVFLSRIMPEKGCDYILEAVKQLNVQGLENAFVVDFYGKVDEKYKDIFERKINSIENANYQGFLDLNTHQGYDKLGEYNMMLFPTYWKGEGFAGIFIDAFIAGLPIIATEWAHNKTFLEENKTAVFIPTHNIVALEKTMKECIDGKYDITSMLKAAQQEAEKYNISNVITKDLLKEIGVI